MSGEGRCRNCSAEILWARLRSGRSIPLDPEPGWAGRYELFEGAKGAIYAEFAKGRPERPIRYRSHLVTCRSRQQVVGS